MKKISTLFPLIVLFIFLDLITSKLSAQSNINRDSIIYAAREIINETTYCALVTINSSGQPQVRTMDPFPSNNDLITWFATSRSSRKVREIKNNPKVCVYFANLLAAKGYVNINGVAEVIDNKDLLLKMKRDYWNGIQNWQNIFVLIKIVPKSIEVINYKHKLTNDPVTFRAPTLIL